MLYCPNCGNKINEGEKFCKNCGKSLEGEQKFNNQPINNEQTQQQQQSYQQGYQQPYQQSYQQPYQQGYQQPYYAPQKNIVQQLSSKIVVEAIIWAVIAGIQLIIAFNLFANDSILYGIFIIVVAALNVFACITKYNYSTEIIKKPVGIVKKFEPINSLIAVLVYNVLFGGIIGVVGTIYAFVIRNFVLKNEAEFVHIEQQFTQENQV